MIGTVFFTERLIFDFLRNNAITIKGSPTALFALSRIGLETFV